MRQKSIRIVITAAVFAIGGSVPVMAQSTSETLAPVDFAFIGSTYLGNKYQVDTGRLVQTNAADGDVRAYAKLMDTSHVAVEDKLVALLQRKKLTQPDLTLLKGAYATIVRSLAAEHGPQFDRDYVKGRVDYQNSNDALYRWEIAQGSDPDLKTFAQEVLPKIDDHLQRAKKLESSLK